MCCFALSEYFLQIFICSKLQSQKDQSRCPEQEACLRGMALDEAIWDFECRWTGISETESSDLGAN